MDSKKEKRERKALKKKEKWERQTDKAFKPLTLMDRFLSKLLMVIGIIVVIIAVLYTLLAYFSWSGTAENNNLKDGLGRKLERSPWLVRTVFLAAAPNKDYWPGLIWFLADYVIILSIFGLGILIAYYGHECLWH